GRRTQLNFTVLTLGALCVALLMMLLGWIINIVREEDDLATRDDGHHIVRPEIVTVRPAHGMEPTRTTTRLEAIPCARGRRACPTISGTT
ncbi:MAG TPA: hypothetical protein VKP69_08965, partial [Isosphaeraceae bacterium]|nr:hypothetical protein [Isosphaeraceae bacterium]